MTYSELSDVVRRVKKEADKKRNDAAYNGMMHDCGASVLDSQAKYFMYGLQQTLPPEWEKYKKMIENESGSEWKEYQRLKEKFNNK